MAASQRLYNAMAQTIQRHVGMVRYSDIQVIRALVTDLCDDLKQDNIHFKKDKFLRHSGLDT